MRSLAIVVALAGCGRLGFDPFGTPNDANPSDGVVADGPSRFGTFAQESGGRGLALASPGGDLFVAGWTQDTVDLGGGPLPFAGATDVFVARYGASGEHMWSHAFGGTGDELLNDVSTDAAGNVYIMGRFTGSIDFGGGPVTSSGDTDAFIASYSPTGQYRWDRRLGTAVVGKVDSLWASVAGPGNTLTIAGLSNDISDLGGGNQMCAGAEQSAVLAQLTTDNAFVWAKCLGGGAFNSFRDVAVDAAGNVYVTGYFTGTLNLGGGDLPTFGGLDIVVASYTSAGMFRWATSFGSISDDWGNRITVDAAGNIVTTGFFESSINPTGIAGDSLTSAGALDAYVVSYTSTGTVRWAKRFGGTGCDVGRRVVTDANAHIWIGGTFSTSVDFGGGALTANGPVDGFVLHLDPAGTYVDAFQIGGGASDDVLDLLVAPTGIIVTGRKDSTTTGCRNSNDYTGGFGYLDKY